MKDYSSEFNFKTFRSSGSGGQNVNKVESAVSIMWDFSNSEYFNLVQKKRIADKLKNKINIYGVIIIHCSESRSQFQNKTIAITKLKNLVIKALIVPKLRLTTKVSKNQKQKRLDAKSKHSEKKNNRRGGEYYNAF